MREVVFYVFLRIFCIALCFFVFIAPKSTLAQEESELTLLSSVFSDARDVEVSGENLFVTNSAGISVLNITDIENPSVVGNIETPDNCQYVYLAVQGSFLFSTQVWNGVNFCEREGVKMFNSLHIFDVSNPSALTETGSVNISGPGGGTGTVQSGVYNYFTNAHGGLVIINAMSPQDPEITEVFAPEGAIFSDVELVGTTAYLSDSTGRIWIVSVVNSQDLQTLSSEALVPGAKKLDINGNYAYVATGVNGLSIIDVRNQVNTSLVGTINWQFDPLIADADIFDVDVDGSFAYLAAGYAGVIVVDISDPNNPLTVAHHDLDGYTTRVEFNNGFIFVADTYKGVNILKYGNPSEEENINLNVPMFKQTDPLWQAQNYDNAETNSLSCGSTIGECGCALSSIAMMLKYHGVDKGPDGRPTTPETLNDYFRKDPVCDEIGCSSLGYRYGLVKWTAAGTYSKDSNRIFDSQKVVFKGKSGFDMVAAQEKLKDNQPVILRVPGNQHWVIAKGDNGSTLAINDPYYDRVTLDDPAYQNTALASRFYEKTASDFSSFEVTAKSPAQILVTDSQGRKTGFDPVANSVYEEIPNSYYDFEGAYFDPSGNNPPPAPGDGIYTVVILTPQQDEYAVKIIAKPEGKYGFTVHASDKDAETQFNIFSGTASKNGIGQTNYLFSYNPNPEFPEKFMQKVKIDIWPFVKKNIIFRRFKYPIPIGILSSETFNAPGDLDKNTLTFGRTGKEKSLLQCLDFYPDLNNDGKKDVYCLFSAHKSNLSNDDLLGILEGKSKNKLSIMGSDTVLIY